MQQPSSSSHLERLLREKVYAVCLVLGNTVEGDPAYTYVAVPMAELERFALAQQEYGFVPAEYGTVLAAGVGEPTEEVMQRMTEVFGFNHEETIVFSDDN